MCKKIILILLFSFLNLSFVKAENKTNILNKVETYLNNIVYFKANFIQDDIANSKLSEGEFYLFRPNKLRIEYQNPFEASLYTDARSTIYYDKELDEVSSIRTANTPLQFLLKRHISFKNKNFSIINIEDNDGIILISFKENGKEERGTLTLTFKQNPLVLSSIKIINGTEQEIEMNLFNISTEHIKDSVFVFKKPKKQNKN